MSPYELPLKPWFRDWWNCKDFNQPLPGGVVVDFDRFADEELYLPHELSKEGFERKLWSRLDLDGSSAIPSGSPTKTRTSAKSSSKSAASQKSKTAASTTSTPPAASSTGVMTRAGRKRAGAPLESLDPRPAKRQQTGTSITIPRRRSAQESRRPSPARSPSLPTIVGLPDAEASGEDDSEAEYHTASDRAGQSEDEDGDDEDEDEYQDEEEDEDDEEEDQLEES